LKRYFLYLSFVFLLFLPLKKAYSDPFFTVEWLQGKAWFQTPTGKIFISMGVNAIGDHS
jgi:hypothetical protein